MPESVAANVPIKNVWNALVAATEWRQDTYRDYDEFFELSDNRGDEDVVVSLEGIQLMWYNAVLVLAEKQFLNIQHVVERPYKEALNFLTWKKNEASKMQLEQLKKKNDLQRRTR